MSLIRSMLFVALTLSVTTAWGQNVREPHIGYLYPAGGQQGTVVMITAGGQFLGGVTDVYVSGEGVHASVIQYIKPFRNLQKEQRQLLQRRLQEVRDKRLAELSGKDLASVVAREKPVQKVPEESTTSDKENAAQTEEVKLPDHPLLFDLENKSLRELAHIRNIIFAPRKKQQPNRQLAEMVLIKITIDSEAVPGNRELRLGTSTGLTNPMVFQVGLLPEVCELEPNNRQANPEIPNMPKLANLLKAKPIDLPVLLNGQITPGDIDRFRFYAQQGQRIVMKTHARSLIPYLADAVPGWFQATLALYDATGREVAFVDDYRFNPDPVLFYQIPEDGEYELEIRDSIYRGREDFIYRIAVGEQPFITQMFPLGARKRAKTTALVDGWNLSEKQLSLDTKSGDTVIRQTVLRQNDGLSNNILYAVDTLPECDETEFNDTTEDSQRIEMPKIINGRIDRPGDIDLYHFEAGAGAEVVAEVYARRLNSPLDALLRLTDASGKVLEWNDDHVIEDNYLYKDIMGLVTHHADSYLTAELPKNGTYYIHLSDSQSHGGMAYAYRLRITAPQPDFALCVTPSSLSTIAGGNVPVCIHALRKDGFDGEIKVMLKDIPAGFQLSGARIPAGCNRVRMTLSVPPKAPDQPIVLKLEGSARIGGQTISHPAVPADEQMQAFLYRHLVPAKELLVLVQKARWRVPPLELVGDSPVRIPAGGSAQVRFKRPRRPVLNDMQLELNEPPEGVTLHDVTVVPEGLTFQLNNERNAVKSVLVDNLIIEAFREFTPKQQQGKPSPQKRRVSMGFLPAVPIEVVPQ